MSVPARVSPWTIFLVALRLGLTSFGGPAANLGYFRREYVERRGWLDDATFADLLALCQFLPGPASSQLGFSIGYLRGGLSGAVLAWIGFTLPSAILMVLFAQGAALLGDPVHAGWLHGLRVAAVAVVAQAVWIMARVLCPDRARATLALVAAAILVVRPSAWGQIAVIAGGAAASWLWLRHAIDGLPRDTEPNAPLRRWGVAWLGILGGLLIALPLLAAARGAGWLVLVDRFYRAGSLVFGGGHVVLPLLEAEVVTPGWVGRDAFLAGYGVAQAVPGPLFTFSAYLGAVSKVGPGGWLGGSLALGAVFLPGLLLVLGVWPFWQRLRGGRTAPALLRGANAAVVGVLLAALYDPVWVTAVTSGRAFALAVAAWGALECWKAPAWIVVLGAAVAGQAVF